MGDTNKIVETWFFRLLYVKYVRAPSYPFTFCQHYAFETNTKLTFYW